MKTITKFELRQLADISEETCVSLYMPGSVGLDSRQNFVRFKNLLREAERKLGDHGLGTFAVQELLAPARELLDRPEFWQDVVHGLAVLLGRDGARIWQMSVACDETCVVGRHFHLLPLLAWLAQEANYYVLAVSQNSVRLFHGSRGNVEEVALPGLPTNREQALHYDEPEPALQSHSGQPQAPGKESMVFHGQGGAVDARKQEILAFFREVDRALADFLETQTEPLIFAGVDYLFPIYQSTNTYPHLLPASIPGNPELWSPHDVQQRAWPLAKSAIDERRQGELAKYWDLVSHDRTLNRVEDIVVAAHAGAVETLFVDPAVHLLGNFFPEAVTVHIDELAGGDAEDLTNLAAVLVLRGSGWVEITDSGNVPGGGPMSAVLRYVFAPAASSSGATLKPRKTTMQGARHD
ncbi:MAG TPA: hypothetical protein VHU84_01340 [Lacipirellulaceae bacterium]|jgi:hypothetical protein|nr:hypothetical protein [Lacipirellulaceae bacterium]